MSRFIYRQLADPTGVEQCCTACLTPNSVEASRPPNLVVARTSVLELYEQDPVTGSLTLLGSHTLFGNVASVNAISPSGFTHRSLPTDALMLTFRPAKVRLCAGAPHASRRLPPTTQ